MRLGLKRKIEIGLALVVATGIVSLVMVEGGLLWLQRGVPPLPDVGTTAESVLRTAAALIPVFLLSAAIVWVVLMRSLVARVRKLIDGVGAVHRGDLGRRIQLGGDDELADLAHEFNRMVAELERTTVSKAALERSEARLRAVNEELTREIAERERAQAESTELQAALKRTELLSAMGALVAGVAHEVRNPLFGISSTLDALQARLRSAGTEGEYEHHLRVLRAELERLRQLMQDLLDYGKPAAVDACDTPVREIVAACLRACQGIAVRRQARIAVNIEPAGLVWPLDRARMEQAVRNLLENAVQHSPSGGTIWLSALQTARAGSPRLRITVADQGPGIDPTQLPHVFTPFFTQRRGGTGLGLSVVERVVEAHGGVVAAANRDDGGAVLTIDLPLPPEQTARREGLGAA
jgi:signal transduction histidine kinase